MVGRKRKAAVAALDDDSTRRHPRRARKAEVKYEESDVEDQQSDDEFNEDAEVSDKADESDVDEDEANGEEAEEDQDEDDEYEAKLKKKGWKKKLGKNGKWEMVIELPAEKDPGDTPYEDERIHPNTMEFLEDLKKNNDREWLKFHDAPFRQAEKDFQSFIGKMTSLVSKIDPLIPERPIKDVIFRIYRDVRFSPDKTPYKPYFSATWSRGGRKGSYAHYYLHIQPGGESFFGGGYYASDNDTLTCIREDIDQQADQFKAMLTSDKLRKTFFPGVKKDTEKVVEAFCKMSNNNALKKKPKGYDADHKDISLLKLRNFVLRKGISDADIVSENAIDIVADIVEATEPFITYLNNAVVPDL